MAQTQIIEGTTLLNPTAEQVAKETPLASRLPTLNGATIAVINALKDPERSGGEVFVGASRTCCFRMARVRYLTCVRKTQGTSCPRRPCTT